MKSKLFLLPSAGEILVCKHPKSKKISIKIRYQQTPKVTIPTLMTYQMGYRFALEKEAWIVSSQKKLAHSVKPVIISDTFKTRFHTLRFLHHTKSIIETKKINQDLFLYFPESENLESEQNQARIKNFITNILRYEAKKYLSQRTTHLAKKHGFTFKQVFVKNLKSRWGSCSGQNNINLNIHLMRLPEHLSDFIILHELCHTVHKNHGSQFHELLNRLCGNEKQLNKELKQFTTLL